MNTRIVVGLILPYPALLIAVGACPDPIYAVNLIGPVLYLSVVAFAVGVGVLIAAAIVKCIDVVRDTHRPPAPPAAPPAAPYSVAEAWGLHAVQAALRPIWLPRNRRVYSETEAVAWSELAQAFDDEHRQQGWR